MFFILLIIYVFYNWYEIDNRLDRYLINFVLFVKFSKLNLIMLIIFKINEMGIFFILV